MAEPDPQAPRSAPRLTFAQVKPEHVSTAFGCQSPECSTTAASVDVVGKGVSHPDDSHYHRELLEGAPSGGGGTIVVKGFLQDHRVGFINTSMPLSGTQYQAAGDALRSGNTAALYAMREDFAPFYCQHCPGVFCAKHYSLQEVWDEAGLDYWTGSCPYGHGKFINH
ncbi:hypothetical protein ACJZ2D_015735 [Fusarium nematophilum]